MAGVAVAGAERPYTERDTYLLERFANFFALAVHRKLVADQLSENERQFRAMFDSAKVSLWNEDFSDVWIELQNLRESGVEDLQKYLEENTGAKLDLAKKLKIKQVNAETIKMFHASSEDELIQMSTRAFGPRSLDMFAKQLAAIWNGDDYFESEANLRTLSGEELDVLIFMPIPKEKEAFKTIPVSVVDMTERVKAEQQLWQTQKVESIGNLAGGIAHDINNMLLPIQALTKLSIDETPEDSKMRKRLEKVYEASDQAKALVAQILAFSRKTEMRFEEIDLADTVRSLMPLLRSTVPSSIEIRTSLNDVGDVLADASQIQAILMNLASNAVDAISGAVGYIAISIYDVAVNKEQALLTSAKIGDRFAVLRMKDSGLGIEERLQNRLFDPFFTTKEPGEGTGLGLHITKQIVEAHSGHIWIDSKLGEGSTFSFTLPLSQN